MPTNYVLIDFENVQPRNLGILADHPFQVLVFIGANQTRVPRNVAVAMQSLGKKAQYVEIDGSGPNALDFHIAYYIGELAATDPAGSYFVISRDKGFDPSDSPSSWQEDSRPALSGTSPKFRTFASRRRLRKMT